MPQARRDGSAAPVPARGGAWRLPNGDLMDPAGYRTPRDLEYEVSFEGGTSFGLGVRARLPLRVLVLDGPGHHSRLIVDVAHSW